jgi:hypothetical protein
VEGRRPTLPVGGGNGLGLRGAGLGGSNPPHRHPTSTRGADNSVIAPVSSSRPVCLHVRPGPKNTT